ncbi:unnamed protein product [Ectocarpus fasciculatus]
MQPTQQALEPPSPPPSSSSLPPNARQPHTPLAPGDGDEALELGSLSLIDRARALCAAADDVQRATIEASRRIAAIHGNPDRPTKKKKPPAPVKEPPDICARLPSDIPPPRGEGWRRLGPVSVVCGSNRISAPPQTNRRALTREVEVCIDGGFYSVVPADIDPGGGFCVSLDRDFAGETNMECMLYLRKKARKRKGMTATTHAKDSATGQTGRVAALDSSGKKEAPCVAALAPSKVDCSFTPAPPPQSTSKAPAPFGSVGETPKPAVTVPAGDRAQPARTTGPPSPFSAGMERELDMFVMSRPKDKSDRTSAAVLEAQRRARRRALSTQKRKTAEEEQKAGALESAKKPPTVADVERLKASRRAALARAASQIQRAKSQKQEAETRSEGERQKREAEAAQKAHALRSAAAARGSIVAAEKKQRERQLELVRQAEAEAKRERVAAVLAYDEAQADERERRVRNETYARIRREERRRELALQRQEDERVEMTRIYEAGERYKGASPVATMIPDSVPPVHSARSFFSITDSTSIAETAVGDNGLGVASSASRQRTPARRKTWRRVDPDHIEEVQDVLEGACNNSDDAQDVRKAELDAMKSSHHQPQENQEGSTPAQHTTTTPPSGGALLEPDLASSPTSARRASGSSCAPPLPGDDSGEVVTVRRGLSKPPLLSPTRPSFSSRYARSASASATTGVAVSAYGSGSRKQRALGRRRISTTPVWKRPAVPLSKPYVPVPQKDTGGRIS